MVWQPKLRAAAFLQKECDRLSSALIAARSELQDAQRMQRGMKIALTIRANRVSALTVEIERLRAQNRRLDQEAERLAEMVQLVPPADAITPAPE